MYSSVKDRTENGNKSTTSSHMYSADPEGKSTENSTNSSVYSVCFLVKTSLQMLKIALP